METKIKTRSVSKPLLKLKLLDSLRHSNFEQLHQLIKDEFQPLSDNQIRQVYDLALHYSVQVAPAVLIKEILQHFTTHASVGSPLHLDVNKQDKDGNTPLHLAAFQSRGDVVKMLMKHPDINDCILNDSHLQPIEMCKNLNIAQMMQVARANYVAEVAQEFRQAFNNKDIDHLNSILSNPRNRELLDINGMEPETGDTVLHEFVKKRDILICRWILDNGGDPFKRDSRGRLPIDLLRKSSKEQSDRKNVIDEELKRMLEKAAREQSVIDVTNNLHEPPTYKGYLKKWTNFAQGYKLRWFILSADGILSYYKDQADTSNACRGSLNMSACYLHLDSSEKLKFEIIGGSNGTIRWHLKGNHPIETNKWVWAIQSAIRFAKDREIMLKNGHQSGPSHVKVVINTETSEKPTDGKTPASMHSLHSFENHPSHRRNKSSSGSISSAELVELNSNLTDVGKQYVVKVKNSRGSNVSSIIGENSSGQHTGLSPSKANDITGDLADDLESTVEMNSTTFEKDHVKKALFQRNIEDDDGDDDDGDDDDDYDDDDDDDNEHINILASDDEDVKMIYGPHSQQISILQRAISIELSSVAELINDINTGDEAMDIAKKSLSSIMNNFADLNTLSQTRDKKLIKMLSKQRDINNLWIKSVKDLEIELLEKGDKLISLDTERKNLKKLLHKKLTEVADHASEGPNSGPRSDSYATVSSAKPLQELAEYIASHESDEEMDSEVDEFFDAEELGEEREKLSEVPNEVSQSPQDSHEVVELATELPVIQELQHGQMIQQSTVESSVNEEKIALKTQSAFENFKEESVELKVNELSINNCQKAKAQQLLSEGSFNGYEDGLRKRLKLGKDDRPSVSLWSVLKSMVGKDMTKMTLPVSFNEPTSLLQRVAEDLEYSQLLNKAACFEDSTLRMLYVAVFSLSSYASTIKRVAKPFNPLLGETFEYSRPDEGYRFFTEQVSHHPPISATWTESPKWDFFGESYLDSKFNGRSFDFKHLGLWYLNMRPDCQENEELYTWKKPNNQVVGILLGKPQVDNYGDVKITNHSTGDYCMLHFKARGWRSNSAYEVKGEVYNKAGGKEWIFGGRWNESVSAKKVLKPNSSEEMQLDEFKQNSVNSSTAYSGGPKYDGSKFEIWQANDRPDFPFFLTKFAVTLNAPQKSLLKWLPPTDTRLRPDQRAMEEGRYDEAADEKHRVEEKQRAARKKREQNNLEYKQQWFEKEVHPITKLEYWKFNGKYWKMRNSHNLANAGDIF